MASFNQFQNILPDPDYTIGSAGQSGGVAGQGFANMKLVKSVPIDRDKTHTGRTITRQTKQAKWIIEVKYNPMTKAQFDPVYNFLMEKKGSLRSFYVSLPPYKEPRTTPFCQFVDGGTITLQNTDHEAGITQIEVTAAEWSGNSYSTTGLPVAGDIFTISDPDDTLHTKAYMVAFVETFDNYLTGNQPSNGHIRLHIIPGLQKYTYAGATINFYRPLIKVVQLSDTREYELDRDNLYSFSLNLEESFY